MSVHNTIPLPTPLMHTLLPLLSAYRPAVRQERTYLRLVYVTLGSVLSLGRHTLGQLLVALGMGDSDWSAWYRLFNLARVEIEGQETSLRIAHAAAAERDLTSSLCRMFATWRLAVPVLMNS